MTYDFRANQVRLNKIISSGSIPILIYPSSSASDFNGNVNFSTSGIGSDVFLFVSGNLDGTSKALFGGNVVTSGSIRSLNGITGSVQYTDDATTPFVVNGPNITTNYNSLGQWEITGSGGGGTNYFTEIALNSIETTGSVAMTYLSASTGAEITGSLAQGLGINVTGFYSHAEGTSTIASGFYAHAEGSSTNAAGLGSHAEGSSTNANGWYSHAEGTFSVTNGDFSHAEGSGATTYGSSSHAEGFAAASYGDFSHAEGAFSATNGLYSHAEGYFTLAHGEASHAEGFGSETIGTGSFAAGLYTVASSSIDGTFPPTTIQAAFGKYNLQGNSDSLFVVGDGFDASNRHDVFRVNSGSVQVTGSFEVLGGITGSISGTVAGNPFIVAGSNITANYNSLGQWEITSSGGGGGGGGTQKQFVAKYEETTSTTPIIIGQFSWIPSDYASLTTLRVRAIMSTDGTANHTGSLQIYNLTSNAYVNLVDTPSVDNLFTITTSTPTLVTSSNLLSGGTNFDNITDSIYEVRISGSTANTTIIGGVELVYS